MGGIWWAAPVAATTAAASPTGAIVAVVATVAFILVMDWVPTPLNRNIAHSEPRDRLIGSVIHLVAGVATVVFLLIGNRWLVLVGAVWFTVVLVSAVLNWWVPYLAGRTPGEIDTATYRREYAANVRVLPRLRGREIVPDVQHTLIHLGVLASAVSCWVFFLSS